MNSPTISPIRAFSDNYIWLIAKGDLAYVVDPGDPEPVTEALEAAQLRLAGILVTHHHYDHTGAVEALQKHTECDVWGPPDSPAGPYQHTVAEGDTISVLGVDFEVLAVPGHTLDHIAYYSSAQKALFCGDTLFVGGCGRVFEGTPSQMRTSLQKLSQLPPDTRIFCAHEYTLANLHFATLVEPGNRDLQDFLKRCEERRRADQPTVPSLIGDELAHNPFLRWDSPEIHQTLASSGRLIDDTPDGVFTAVREWKNNA